MENNAKLIESLLESAAEYGKTSIELMKLKTLDKSSDFVSSFIPHSVTGILLAAFVLFFNLGLAFWLGEIFGKIFLGFFVVAAFYGMAALILHFFMHKWLKGKVNDFIIKQVLK